MNTNMGKTDKLVRIIIGLVIAIAGFYYQSWWGLIAIVPFFTAFSGRCLLYAPFGISTSKLQEKKSK